MKFGLFKECIEVKFTELSTRKNVWTERENEYAMEKKQVDGVALGLIYVESLRKSASYDAWPNTPWHGTLLLSP
jgi:hypothetical protein